MYKERAIWSSSHENVRDHPKHCGLEPAEMTTAVILGEKSTLLLRYYCSCQLYTYTPSTEWALGTCV